ncbi:hypothetical protein RB195_010819 [Necator americanus]|uniref:Reverse transcriptase domain-containing protein n=1 Tax=Necator americanus TaxID=51031 RepID=A0ABR1CZX1_NECAM
MSGRNRTARGPDRVTPEHLKNLPPVLNSLARLFTRYLSECKVSREYKMPLCLTFSALKKAFDSVETEAVMEALDN